MLRIPLFLAMGMSLLGQEFTPVASIANLVEQAQERLRVNDLAAVEQIWSRALQESEAIYGPEHPATAMFQRNLAGTLRREGKLQEASVAAKEALRILEKRFGATDIILSPALNTLAEIQMQRGYLNAAHQLLNRAYAIGSDAGPHYQTTLADLGALHRLLGNERKASEYLRRTQTAAYRSKSSN